MGTLDDAIREHLDLKRRAGAPEEEVEQKQAEALGGRPAASELAPPADAQPPPEAMGDAPEAETQPPPMIVEPELSASDQRADRNGFSEPAAEPEPDTAAEAAEFFDRDALDPEPAPLEEPTVRRTSRAEPEPEEPVEDFLEETPDFLEETPEHDRLWFEQGPPKDFDFD